MSEPIGQVAGKIWDFLNKNEPASPSKIAKEIKVPKNDLQRAIGWLAREEKITIELNGRVETLSLK
ncbi:MAG: winged helix-turn-helix domain-containing protein [Methylococcales bacterium]|nr:winged helix-turn-helix domain-containing protein [Methylococcales bacterium]MCK5925689.1 winged helix-turn-helix domain-containing protein [Methylococcales bacterium]